MRVSALVLVAALCAGCTSVGSSPLRGYRPASSELIGDVDGNGTRDRVHVAAADGDPCDLLLVVGGDRHYSLEFDVECGKPSELAAAPPYVEALADLDGRRGLEIVVEIGRGATREFARLFTVRDGTLVPIAIDGESDGLTLDYGGSVGTGDSFVDCARRPGEVVITSRSFADRTLTGARYRFVGTRLRHVASKQTRLGNDGVPAGPQPFPSCTRVRAYPT